MQVAQFRSLVEKLRSHMPLGTAKKILYIYIYIITMFSSVQWISRARLFEMPGLPVHHQLPESTKLISIELVMPSNHLILCHPLLLLPSIFPSIRVFSNESAFCIRWPKYYSSASTSVLPMNSLDWSPLGGTGLLAVQGTLKSLLQYHN